MRAARLIALGLAAVLLATLACAQGADSHQAGAFESLVARSPFLHGYLHGYEAGFHDGDIDLQLGRNADLSRYKHETRAFTPSSHDRAAFVRGFTAGFRVAYVDAFFGRSFRAFESFRQIEAQLPQAGSSRDIDSAVVQGYFSGLSRGLHDGRRGDPFQTVSSGCDSREPGFCSVFTSAYRFGYADGYLNQRSEPARNTAVAAAGSQ